jgi:hypothetical protein
MELNPSASDTEPSSPGDAGRSHSLSPRSRPKKLALVDFASELGRLVGGHSAATAGKIELNHPTFRDGSDSMSASQSGPSRKTGLTITPKRG